MLCQPGPQQERETPSKGPNWSFPQGLFPGVETGCSTQGLGNLLRMGLKGQGRRQCELVPQKSAQKKSAIVSTLAGSGDSGEGDKYSNTLSCLVIRLCLQWVSPTRNRTKGGRVLQFTEVCLLVQRRKRAHWGGGGKEERHMHIRDVLGTSTSDFSEKVICSTKGFYHRINQNLNIKVF